MSYDKYADIKNWQRFQFKKEREQYHLAQIFKSMAFLIGYHDYKFEEVGRVKELKDKVDDQVEKLYSIEEKIYGYKELEKEDKCLKKEESYLEKQINS